MSNSVVEPSEFYTICILECIRGLFDTVWNKDLFYHCDTTGRVCIVYFYIFSILTKLAGFVIVICVFSVLVGVYRYIFRIMTMFAKSAIYLRPFQHCNRPGGVCRLSGAVSTCLLFVVPHIQRLNSRKNEQVS